MNEKQSSTIIFPFTKNQRYLKMYNETYKSVMSLHISHLQKLK
jgi:hypothetical protein